MAVDVIPQEGCVLENIEMRAGNQLPSDTVVERGEGEFLVLDRLFSYIHRDGNETSLIYGVQRRLTPCEFYDMIGMRATGPCTADDISDHLVKAFDYGVANDLGLKSALFAYRSVDRRFVHQHSC